MGEKENDFCLGHIDLNVLAGHSCGLKHSMIPKSIYPIQRCKIVWTGHSNLGITSIKITLADHECKRE